MPKAIKNKGKKDNESNAMLLLERYLRNTLEAYKNVSREDKKEIFERLLDELESHDEESE